MVTPQTSSRVACGDNIALAGVGHNALLADREAIACTLGLIDQARAAPERATATSGSPA